MKTCVAAVACVLLIGCSDGGEAAPDTTSGSDGGRGKADSGASPDRAQDAGPMQPLADAGDDGVRDSGAGGDLDDAGSDAGSASNTAPTELPSGSREVDGIVNLVDAEAAQQLEDYILDEAASVFPTLRHGLTLPANLFLEHYREEYDFLIFFTDHEIAGGTTIAKFEAVNRPAVPGGTIELEIQASGYRTTGRLKGVIGARYRPQIFPPLAHEVFHYWGNNLDPRFGFGLGLNEDFGSHWGMSSVRGVLGGFDGESLRCETPAGMKPPACTALPSGRTRYVVERFVPQDNTAQSFPYAPLELYLMGLVPATQVQDSFQMLVGGAIDWDSFDAGANTVEVEADRIDEVPLSDIVARHGRVESLAEDERDFKVAFIVVSEEPAADEVMNEVADWAALFGARRELNGWPSFEETASGHATMDTRLGKRRAVDDPAPKARAELRCDVVAQDCPRPELGCYEYTPAACALSGGVAAEQPCDAQFACAPGLECMGSATNPDTYLCTPYCDLDDDSSEQACATLCPDHYLEFRTTDGDPVSAACAPE